MTREDKVDKLIKKYGYSEYCKMAFERYEFPFMWSIDNKGEIQLDLDGLGDYLKREMSKGLTPNEIIQRDKKIQEDAVSSFYKDTFELEGLSQNSR